MGLLLSSTPLVGGASLAAANPTGRAAAVAHPSSSAVRAPVNEDILLTLPAPSVPGPNGSRLVVNGSSGDLLAVTVNISVTTFNPSWGLLSVHLPAFVVKFPTVGGADPQFPFSVPPKNLTFSAVGSLSYVSTLTLNQPAPFHIGWNATLTSQGFAPSSSLPWGTVAFNVSWSYNLSSSAGSAKASSGSSARQAIFPAQTVTITYSGPSNVPVGTQFTACLAGPIGNRTFGLRGVNATGVVFANLTQPVGSNSTICLALPIPASYSPQKSSIQLWEYTNEPLRLRLLPATAVSAPIGRLAGVVQPTNLSALLVIDGFPVVGTAGGSYSVGLPTGAHRWFFNVSGYWPQADLINITANRTVWLNLTLLPRTVEPTTPFGSPPLLSLSLLQLAGLAFGLLALVAIGVYLARRRRPGSPDSASAVTDPPRPRDPGSGGG
jgi:hypothetical protein